jgi:RNA-binding protein 5/10
MVRGNVIINVNETTLLDIFNKYATVRDIRLVKNKSTGLQRDFAFIEFYTIEEAETVLKYT